MNFDEWFDARDICDAGDIECREESTARAAWNAGYDTSIENLVNRIKNHTAEEIKEIFGNLIKENNDEG